MSSQDGSNRSRRTPRTSEQPRRTEDPKRRSQTWDVDPAEIDRYLSGRPTRSEESARQPRQGRTSGSTADELTRLQNVVGRRRDEQRPSAPAGEGNPPRREPRREAPQRESYDTGDDAADDFVYDDVPYADDSITSARDYDAWDDEPWEEPEPAPPPRRRTAQSPARRATRQQRPARRYDPEPLDVDEDDELYNDDPYLGYEDDQIDRRPPRPARVSRQRATLRKPNLPRVTLPKSMTDSPLLSDTPALVMIGIAVVSVALMSFVVSDRMSVLGDTIPTHVSASGDPENLQTREAIWNIPLLAGMVMLMNVAATWFISRIDQFASRFLLGAGLLVHFIAWVALVKYLW